MKLHFKNGLFYAEASYNERMLPKEAGFRWHGTCGGNCPACLAGLNKVWWTNRVENANRLISVATSEAKIAIEEKLNKTEQLKKASWAEDAEIDIKNPPGKEYRGYQRAGIKFILDAFKRNQKGVLLADQMGTGKSAQAIGAISCLNLKGQILIVCPASLILNWKREIDIWLPGTAVQCIAGREPINATAKFIIINYDKVSGPHGKKTADMLLSCVFDVVIFDEVHMLKERKAQRTKVFFGEYTQNGKLKNEGVIHKAPRALFLTGTPVQNKVKEFVTTLQAMGCFGTFDGAIAKNATSFLFRYCDPKPNPWSRGYTFDGATNLPELQDKLRSGWMIRRLKKDVLKELPPKIRQLISIGGELAKQAQAQEKLTYGTKFSAIMEGREEGFDSAVASLQGETAAFEEISRLRAELAKMKIDSSISHVEELLSEGKVIFFAHHKVLIEAMAARFQDCSIVIDGSVPPNKRQALVDAFQNDPSVTLAILSTHAAGVGLTLTSASVVVFGEADWNPSWLVQAEDRAHRIGQTAEAVLVHYLVFDGTLDARVIETAIKKMDVADSALDRAHEKEKEIAIKSYQCPKCDGISSYDLATHKAECQICDAPSSKNELKTKIVYSEEMRTGALEAMKILAARCDGARDIDGAGFNKIDSNFGKSLAQSHYLSDKQMQWALFFARKYRKQLPDNILFNCGILKEI